MQDVAEQAPEVVAQIEKLRAGLAVPLEERQARWDRVREWTAAGRSLAEIVRLEAAISGLSLSRERIRAIKSTPRPGSVGRPTLPGLLSRQRVAKERVVIWRKRPKTEHQALNLAAAKTGLAEINALVKAAQKRGRA